MKITVVGFVALVGAVLLVALVYQAGLEIDKNGRAKNEQPNGLS